MRKIFFTGTFFLFSIIMIIGQQYSAVINFNSNPSGAKVYSGIEGSYINSTTKPFSIEVTKEYIDLPYIFVIDGYYPEYVTINPYYNNSLSVTMTKKELGREMVWNRHILLEPSSNNSIIKEISRNVSTVFYSNNLEMMNISYGSEEEANKEKKYYFDANNLVDLDANCDEGSFPNVLTLKSVTISGNHKFEIHDWNTGIFPPVYKTGSFWSTFFFWVEIWQNNTCIFKDGYKDRKKNLFVGDLGGLNYKDKDSNDVGVTEEIIVNSLGTLDQDIVFYKNLIIGKKPLLFFTPKSHTQIEDPKPAWGESSWRDVRIDKITWYKAKSPVPRIKTVNMLPKIPIDLHNKINLNIIKNKLEDINITFEHSVKLACYYIYNTGNELKDFGNYVANSQYGINNINITSVSNLSDGKYKFILAVVDKFNKFYIFETEYFILDKTPPSIEGIVVNKKNKFGKNDDKTILSWQTITDLNSNFDGKLGPNIIEPSDYIYIKISGENDYKKIKDVTSFKIEGNSILLNSDGIFTIDDIVIKDQAGNQSSFYIDTDMPIRYFCDTTPPVITNISEIVDKYYKRENNIKATIFDHSEYIISKITFTVNNTDYLINDINLDNNTLTIGLDYSFLYNQSTTFNIKIEACDGMNNSGELKISGLNFDEILPIINISIGDVTIPEVFVEDISKKDIKFLNEKILVNFTQLFKSQVIESNLKSKEVSIISKKTNGESNASSNNNVSNVLFLPDFQKELKKTNIPMETYEILEIYVKAIDKANNYTERYLSVFLYEDSNAPVIEKTGSNGFYSIKISEITKLHKIYIKDIPCASGEAILDDFKTSGELPPSLNVSGWNSFKIDNDLLHENDFFIMSGTAICIMAEDIWGNITNNNDSVKIMTNKSFVCDVINEKSDLNKFRLNIGGVDKFYINSNLIFKNSIILEKNDPELVITTTSSSSATNETFILFQDKINKEDKIRITNNGGKITIDSTNGCIRFLGAGNVSSDNYKWFGFINSGDLNNLTFMGNKGIYFENAISPLSYNLPEPKIGYENKIILSNINFNHCFIGIHIIDSVNNYVKLIISNLNFSYLIYGIKFDFDTYANGNGTFNLDSAFGNVNLEKSNCIFKNIIRAQVYSPIDGIKE